jgi:peptide/nickel transport system permease protein
MLPAIFRTGFLQHITARLGLFCIVSLILCSTFSSHLTKYDPAQQGDLLTERYLAPSLAHPFGTDKFGRDVFSRVLHGGRISLTIAFCVVLFTIVIGTFYGTIAGYTGGIVDAVMMRFLDFFLAFPAIFFIITISAIMQLDHWYLIPILGLTGWMETARLVRAEVLTVKERDYVLAARGLGFSRMRILFRHVIPNCMSPVIVAATLKIGEVILLESALSFLGIGVQPPTPSWGNIINDGREVLLRAWWVATFPGIFIMLSVVSFNLISESIHDYLERPCAC